MDPDGNEYEINCGKTGVKYENVTLYISFFGFFVTYEFSYFRQGRLDFMDMIQEAMAHNKHISDYKFDVSSGRLILECGPCLFPVKLII